MPDRILIVEDDASVRRSMSELLIGEGFDVSAAESAEAALSRLTELSPDVVITDIRMPGMSGTDLLRLLRERAPGIDVIVMTAYEDMPTVVAAMRDGAFDFLVKPIAIKDLRAVLSRVTADRRARAEAARSSAEAAEAHRLDALVGRDEHMLAVYKRVGQVAASRVSALIRGETGTGKGEVARAIHYNSAWAAEPFVAVNCTALPESLLESELFGHVRGAFTGAVSDRRGRFALAGKGTIFLDEVGDTTLEFQAKLLRVLEDREFYPVGAEKADHTEARVIAATHRDLEQLVKEGRFREDLYYRLRVVEIVLPPLRERPDDIPLLARHLTQRTSVELHRPTPALSEEALSVIMQYDWPGNVRELQNCLARAVVLATGGVIRAEHLGLSRPAAAVPAAFPTLEAMEAEHTARALAFAGGNRTRAAEILGISKPRLYRIIARHHLDAS